MRGAPGPYGAGPHPGRALGLICAFALCVRLAVVDGTIGFHTPAALEPASDSHIHIALVESLLGGRGYSLGGARTAITPPLYIFFLAALYRLVHDPAAVRLVQAGLGAVGCLLIYAIGRRLFDHVTGLLAAAILSVHPLVVYLAGLHLTENLFLVLLLIAILQALRVAERPTVLAAAALGGVIGLAALTRAAFVAFLPFLLAWTVSLWGIRSPHAYRVFALVAIGAAVVILPWTVRNYLALGTVVPVQSNAGLMFWAGNNPRADGGLVWPSPATWTADTAPPNDGRYGWRGLSVAAANRRYTQVALSWIGGHPRDYARLLVRKVIRLYGFTRAADREDLGVPRAVVLFQTLLLASAAAGILLAVHKLRTASLLLALVIFTNVVALLFSGGTRYTLPMVPSLIVFSAECGATAARLVAHAFGGDRVAVGG